jgi:3-methyl-2-oxobutanoate hydroxymethyltransferase
MKNIFDFLNMKEESRKITMVTCYDSWSARLLKDIDIDMLLVGDSVAMVLHGFDTTVPATMDMMELHTAAVARAGSGHFIVGDLPFLSNRQGLDAGVRAAGRLMQAGAQAVKLEGARGNLELVRHLTESGIPVMGHLGLTPQRVFQLGGFRVQAKDVEAQEELLSDALALETAGCFSLVLECVPQKLAAHVSSAIKIPTIGIGAGLQCDGQVLVLHDLLGLSTGFKPKFLRSFGEGSDFFSSALNAYVKAVREGSFPNDKESYS